MLKSRLGIVSALIVLPVIVYFVIAGAGRGPSFPEGLIQANGRIEGDVVIVASKQPGTITEILAREGDAVTRDQVVLSLDDRATRARVKQAQAAVNTAHALALQCDADLNLLRKEVPIHVESARADLRVARATLKQAVAQEEQARHDHERYDPLAKTGTVTWQVAEQARTQWHQAQDEVLAARSQVAKSLQQINDVQLGPERVESKAAQVAAFKAAALEAEARLGEAITVLDDLTIKTPVSGTIVTRFANLGEVVGTGMPLYEVVDLSQLYLKVYVPETQIGQVRLGLPAQVYVDAFPDQPFAAHVGYIASRAEFTPKEIQTPDERVKLVYAVKLFIDANPEYRLTPGIPADAVIRWLEQVPWTKPVW